MNFQVYRTHASSYQDSKYLANEKKVLEEISDVNYIQTLQQYQPGSKIILITNTHTDPHLIPERILKETVLMIHPNSGYDNLSDEFRRSAEFPIIIGNPIRANAVVEYTLGCMFKHFSPIPNHHHWQTDRAYPRKLIRDQNILLLGHGNIGKILANSLTPLCPKLTVFDPFVEAQHIPYPIHNEWSNDLLKNVSILICAASLNQTSRRILNKSNINELNSECLILNPARGELFQEEELIHFLQKNPKSFAYLDVFEREPFAPGYGSQVSNLNKTSHIAGMYRRLNNDIISFEFLVIKDFIRRFQQNSLNEFKQDYAECILDGNDLDARKISPST